jgi:hypothetical protein
LKITTFLPWLKKNGDLENSAGSGLAITHFAEQDRVASIKKLAVRIAECGFRIAEFKDKNRRAEDVSHSVRLKAPAYAQATAGRQS